MEPKVVRLFDVDVEPNFQGPVFSLESPDLDCNFLRFDGGEGVPLHINAHRDRVNLRLGRFALGEEQDPF